MAITDEVLREYEKSKDLLGQQGHFIWKGYEVI